MNFEQLIARAKDNYNSKASEINTIKGELDQLRGQSVPDPARVADLQARRASAENDLPGLKAHLDYLEREKADDDRLTAAAATVDSNTVRTPNAAALTRQRSRTYEKSDEGVFLRDLFDYSTGNVRGDAATRLLKHEQEARDAGQWSERAGTTSSFGGIVPPQYLIDKYALIARAGRPTANVVQHLDLPSDGMSLILPKSTTGVITAVQAAENTVLATQDQVWTNITIPVVTVGAYNDVSRQAVERAEGVDQIVFGDLVKTYAVNVDQQVLTGTGASGQALGILNTSGTSQATAFTAAATTQTFYNKLAQMINAIQTTRYLAPTVIVMHPRRWNWLLTQVDSTGRPLVVPSGNGPFNGLGTAKEPLDTPSANAVGNIFGINVVTDANIPTTVGSGPEDQVIVMVADEVYLWEDPGAPFTLKFEQTLSSSLTIRLVAYGYFAFTAQRYPTAVGIVGGNSAAGFGLVAPTF